MVLTEARGNGKNHHFSSQPVECIEGDCQIKWRYECAWHAVYGGADCFSICTDVSEGCRFVRFGQGEMHYFLGDLCKDGAAGSDSYPVCNQSFCILGDL